MEHDIYQHRGLSNDSPKRRPTRAKSEPRSPRSKRRSWADANEEVDIEIQSSPPYRIVPKPKKPKTPPPPRPLVNTDGKPQRSASFRSPRREVVINREGDIEFRSHSDKTATKPRTVKFNDQIEMLVHSDEHNSTTVLDILNSVETLRLGEKLEPVITNPGDSPPIPEHQPKDPSLDCSIPLVKPKVDNVKLAKCDLSVQNKCKQNTLRRQTSQSLEGINRMDILLDLCDMNLNLKNQSLRSSFVDPDAPTSDTRRSVYIDLGDYQTLLKHSKREEHVYSLPQPLCYGNDTLRAVKMITDKYDTFKRRQLQAQSFGCEDGVKMEEDHGGTGPASDPPDSSDHVVPNDSLNPSDLDPLNNPSAHHDPGCLDTPIAPEAITDIVENIPSVQETSSTPIATQELAASVDEPDSQTAVQCTPQPSCILPERTLDRVDMFYRSHGAEIRVCRCLADVYIGTRLQGSEEVGQWQAYHTGVPVLVLNTGTGRRRRELNLLIAEETTGFPLWQDRVSYLTSYTDISPLEHTLYLSGSLHKMAKLHFYHKSSACEFLSHFQEITSDPNDDLWKVSSKSRDKHRWFKSKRKLSKPNKKEISQPCNFSHITRLNAEPCTPPSTSKADSLPRDYEGEFRPRLPTS